MLRDQGVGKAIETSEPGLGPGLSPSRPGTSQPSSSVSPRKQRAAVSTAATAAANETAGADAEQPAAAPPTNPNKEVSEYVQVDHLGRTFHERVEVSAALLFRTSPRAVSFLSTILTASHCRVVRFGRGQRH